MKRIAVILVACLAFVSVYAQTEAETLWDNLKGQGQVSMYFSIKGTDSDGVVVTSEDGTAYMNGECYRIECGDMLICCDGESMWMYNSSSEELVIDRNEALPFMRATDVKRDQRGAIYATYEADDITFRVKITDVQNPTKPFAPNYFTIDVKSLSDDVIVTDLRE